MGSKFVRLLSLGEQILGLLRGDWTGFSVARTYYVMIEKGIAVFPLLRIYSKLFDVKTRILPDFKVGIGKEDCDLR